MTHATCVQVRVRFSAREAISELLRLHLIDESDNDKGDEMQHYVAVSPARASDHLNGHWRKLLSQRVDECIQYIE